MPFDSFFRMLVDVMTALLKVIQRVVVNQHTLISLVPEDSKRLAMDIVFTAADSAHAQCAKLLSFRSEQNARLNPHDFYRLLAVSRGFIQHSDTLCFGRACLGLRGTLLSQVLYWGAVYTFIMLMLKCSKRPLLKTFIWNA